MHVRNWSKFQHYTKRKPPWIRFYRDTLDDVELAEISDAAFRLLACCWLLASEDPEGEGNLPPIKSIAFRTRRTTKEVADLLPELAPWLDDASTVLAECKQVAIPDQIRSETDQNRADQTQSAPTRASEFDRFWKVYPNKTAKGGARKAFARAAKLKVWPGTDAVIEAVERAKESRQWQADNGQYIPGPAKWLNNGQWDDEQTREGQGGLELLEEIRREKHGQ